MSLTTQDLVDQVRQQLDEFNEETVTDVHIINILNRAQRKAANITSRRLDEMLLEDYTFTTTAETSEYAMPSDIFARRVETIEVEKSGVIWNIERISLKDSNPYRDSNSSSLPYYYLIKGTKIVLMPTPSEALTIRVWYAKKPDKYVLPQGRITNIDTTNNYVIVDSIGDDVTTTGLNAYLSIVDWQTGEIKVNLQTDSTDTTNEQINFKASGLTRSTVLSKTVTTAIGSDAAVDDYVCVIAGTCVPQLPEAYIDYQVQYAVVDVKKRFGEPSQDDYYTLRDLEKELKKMWSGRERKTRVRKTNSHYGTNFAGGIRRYFL